MIVARIVAVCALFVLGALPGGAAPPHFEITIENASPYFSPSAATVTTGTPIRWDNSTPTEHTITHDGCLTEEGPCAFDSETMLPNEHYTIAGLPPGRYAYHCRVHPIMRGTLLITDTATPQI
jgi:plastocyanin